MPHKTPNEVHQLLITVSKHFHISLKGEIRYQIKPMEVTLKNLKGSERNHFVHYIIRDEASGFFYAECCSHKYLIPIKDFLLRSWFEKQSSTFCGIPKFLMCTKTVIDFFGHNSYEDLLTELNIKPLVPGSGFSSGVRVIKDWENIIYIRSAEDDDDFNDLRLVSNWNSKTTAFYSNVKSSRYSEVYRTVKRLVPKDDYEAYLIGKYGSNDFKKTDVFPITNSVLELSLLLKTSIPD